ncbi:Predicted alpha-1,6-mannanase, GH76 family [Sanguibacter gelidistatuariae]|uniref:Predicted alpha-1,6-mannanase, GH76 family n=1 Tax=Sanguibacter gelidistatuariae TaxID=1814289 RepID=A0A1G6KML7_9MICO|nr:glycoside hydrolase family 76 protein [Sanguibacter gelidistatuariae]SDC32213.1 Predicted alpha-1,6-mannanase, GH76 family [Sanguibacter gelidistatuariae]
MTSPSPIDWSARADLAQDSLDHFYGAPEPQFLTNWVPAAPGSNDTFNYWWLAHALDARLDAFERTSDPLRLEQALAIRSNLLARNEDSLFNDYFDDMLWFALALHRLAAATGDQTFHAEAVAVWEHTVAHGWNDIEGASLSWRTQQPYYKNAPANGPFIILSARLFVDTADDKFLTYGKQSFDWLTQTLVNPKDGFVEDGINRAEDHAIDLQWRFTYNQGLYIGACVELAAATGDASLLDAAERTALTAVRELTTDGVFTQEGTDGDEGLFKGVYYRYLQTLLAVRAVPALSEFVQTSTDRLWASSPVDGWLFPGNDWNAAPTVSMPYSTMLSAIMATEVRARAER